MSSGGTGRAVGDTSSTEKNMHLYDIMGIAKNATDDEIKKAYRRLALRYHPDKNIDGDPEKTEMFKEINYANGILSNPNKRKVYDEMGEAGLKLLDQFGDDEKLLRLFLRPWFKWLFLGCGLLTCCYGCCCCFCCCFYFCCGKFKPKTEDDSDSDSGSNEPITTQPGVPSSPPSTIPMGAPSESAQIPTDTSNVKPDPPSHTDSTPSAVSQSSDSPAMKMPDASSATTETSTSPTTQ